jgi:hypothetical protein
MTAMSTEAPRIIIEDFAKEIREKKRPGPKPSKDVINFRNEMRLGTERDVEYVPVNLLRYRMDNGRIASDVLDYVKCNGPLREDDDAAQTILAGFLEKKDPEKTEELLKSIQHNGQREAAIITCDGFLINGNRRKMALEQLKKQHPGKPEYEFMKVVILPGQDDAGGSPTILDIEKLENRYQRHKDGKAEYYGFDQALSIQRKIELGYSLKAQLEDDPLYVHSDAKQLKQAEEDVQQEYLRPLACVDRYLQLFGREGLYGSVSSSRGDREGRWQAFKDYSETYQKCFKNEKWMLTNALEEEEVGELEDAVFKIIKLRDLRGLCKLHKVMRDLGKLAADKDSRKELCKISEEVEPDIPEKDCFDNQGKRLSHEEVDEKWVERYQTAVIRQLQKAIDHRGRNQEKETPISLLNAALQKLNHDNMRVENMGATSYSEARKLASDIQSRAKELETEIYHAQKNLSSLARKK